MDPVRAFLTEHLSAPGHDIGEVELVGEGAWSRCYAFADAGTDFVIRFGATDEDFRKDQRAATFASPALPVPEVTAIGEAFDGYYAISTRAYGRPLETCTTPQWRAVLPSLLAALDAMRALDVTATTGFGGWDGDGVAPHPTWAAHLLAVDEDSAARRTHGWTRKLADSVVGIGPFRTALADLRARVVDLPTVRHVIHADLINRNVLVDGDRVTSVFDWGCAAYGDFLYDVAWLEFWAPWHASLAAIDIRMVALAHLTTAGADLDLAEERLRCCLLHIGLDHMAYTAHTGAADDLVAITRRTLDLVPSVP